MARLSRLILPLTFFLSLALTLPRVIVWQGLCSRSLECAGLYRSVSGPFHRQFQLRREKICGDLGTLANLPSHCEERHEIFETDKWGYRNSQDVWNQDSTLVLFGDSFAFGQGVTQDDDPAMQLQKISGLKVYNAAGKIELEYLRWVVDHLKSKPKTVVYLHLERHRHRPVELNDWQIQIHEYDLIENLKVYRETLSRYNPLKILFSLFDKKYLTPGIFPNRFESSVTKGALINGKEFLFLESSVKEFKLDRSNYLEGDTEYFTGVQQILEQRGIKFVLGLIPEKYTVYAPILKSLNNQFGPSGYYLDELFKSLQMKGVMVVNFLPLLSDGAQKGLSKNKYIYWPDDTHWNPDGIEISMKALAKVL